MSSVRTIIKGVRDLSPHFDERRITNAALFRALARYQEQLLGKMIDRKRDSFTKYLELLVSNFVDDEPLGNLRSATTTGVIEVFDGQVVFEDTDRLPQRLTILPFTQRLTPFFEWGAWIDNRAPGTQSPMLFLLGTETDWTGVEKVVLRYAARVQNALTGLDSNFDLPDAHDDVLIAYGGHVAAGRCEEMDLAIDTDRYEREWLRNEKAFLDRVTGVGRASVGVATETW